jgi:cytochrome c biogenesis protein CcmG, thiol:disulfide interchange protein DsbE
MKILGILVTIASYIFTPTAWGQTKYYKTPEGNIIDSVAYEKAKADYIEQYKQTITPYFRIQDFLNQEYATPDSVVYTYRWQMVNTLRLSTARGVDYEKYMGKVFPLNKLKKIDNTAFSIEDLKGKPSLINFWFIECPPCLAEIPALNNVKAALQDSVNFIAITFNWRKDVMKFLKKEAFNFTHITNARWLIDDLGIHSFPLNVFLDKEGKVVHMTNSIPAFRSPGNSKPVMGNGKQFELLLRTILAQN